MRTANAFPSSARAGVRLPLCLRLCARPKATPAIFFGREPGNSEFADVDPIARAGSLDVVLQGLVGDFQSFRSRSALPTLLSFSFLPSRLLAST